MSKPVQTFDAAEEPSALPGLILAVAAIAAVAGFALETSAIWAPAVLLGVLAVSLLKSEKSRSVQVTITKDRLAVGEHVPMDLRRLTGGFASESSRGPSVTLLEGPDVLYRLGVASLADANRLLEALVLDAGHKTVTLPAGTAATLRGRARLFAGVLATFSCIGSLTAAALVSGMGWAAIGIALASMWLPIIAAFGATATVGTDGVLLWWRGMTSLIPLRGAREVLSHKRSVRIVYDDDHFEDIPAGSSAKDLADRIRAAIAAGQKGDHADVAALDRSGRSIAVWVEGLRAAGSATGGFREAGDMSGRMWSIVEDAAAPQWKRIAAAVAVSPGLSSTERARLRACAASIADSRVRIALDAIVDGDETTASDTLDALEQEASMQSHNRA